MQATPAHPSILIQNHPLHSSMGMLDATATMMMQQKIADAYEDANVIWDQNNANRPECDFSPDDPGLYGPNETQQKIQDWLAFAGLIRRPDPPKPEPEPEVAPEPEEQTPRPSRWRRYLRISMLSPRKRRSSAEASREPSRSPISPIKFWVSIRKRATSIGSALSVVKFTPRPTVPVSISGNERRRCRSEATVQLKSSQPACKQAQPSPSATIPPEPLSPLKTIISTEQKPEMHRRMTIDDSQALVCCSRRQETETIPIPVSAPPPIAPEPTAKPISNFRRNLRSGGLQLDPSPTSRRTPSSSVSTSTAYPRCSKVTTTPPDVRWYHIFLFVTLWQVLLVCFYIFGVLRILMKIGRGSG